MRKARTWRAFRTWCRDLRLAQPKCWNQHVAVTPEIGMTSAVAHDLDADELIAIESDIDDKLAGGSAENAAVSVTNDFRATLEDPLVGVEAVRVT